MYRREDHLTPGDMPATEDTLIEAGLDEVLGGQTPPDLTGRILAALAARRAGGTAGAWPSREVASTNGVHPSHAYSVASTLPPQPPLAEPIAPPVQPPVPLANGHFVANSSPNGQGTGTYVPIPAADRRASSRGRRQKFSPWWALAAAASVLLVVVGGSIAYLRLSHDHSGSGIVAENASTFNEATNGSFVQKTKQAPDTHHRDGVHIHDFAFNGNLGQPGDGAGANASQPNDLALPPKELPSRLGDEQIIASINQHLKSRWQAAGITPSPLAGDAQWCRRAFKQIIGRAPREEELNDFVRSKSINKKDELVVRLLGAEYQDQFAQHWASVWADALLGSVDHRAGDATSREGLEAYLREAITHSKPYDQIARDLITATGSNKPGAADFNGATNFLLTAVNDGAVEATMRTCRTMLGKRMECAECHDGIKDSPATQEQFFQIASFFRQATTIRDRQTDSHRLVNRDFAGESGDVEEADVFFERDDRQLRVAYPVFFDGTALPRSGRVVDVDRRAALAKLVTRDEDFAKTFVNRLWAEFFHHGFTPVVDDLHGERPSHPELLETLAQQTAAHGFDQRQLMRWIALSDAFARSEEVTDANRNDNPAVAGRALFSRYYREPQPHEAVYASALEAVAAAQRGDRQFEQARKAWLGRFSSDDVRGNIPEIIDNNAIGFGGQIPTALAPQVGLLEKVAASKMSAEQKINHLFVSALGRKANDRELNVAKEVLAKQANDTLALEDLWWALVQSAEFAGRQ